MNFMREAIEATQRQARLEDRWQAAVERIKAKKETVGFPDLTCYIRAHEALPYSKLPENVAREIIRGLTHGPTGEWAWSIPVLLHSAHPGVKASLYKAVIRRKRLSPRAVLGVLADTRGPTTRQERPWKVAEECSDTHVSVIVTLHGREIARGVASHGPETHEDAEKALYVALGLARAEAVERVFDHFY